MPRSIHAIGSPPKIDLGVDVYVYEAKVNQARELIARMPEIERLAYRKGTINFGKMLARYVRKCIITNTPPPGVSWPPHSEDYLKRYDVKGFWYLSGQMLKSIRVREYNGERFYVGPDPGEAAIAPVNKKGRSHPSHLTLIQLAKILETGSYTVHNDIPPRPLFRPSFKAVGGAERLKKYIVANLRLEIKKALR